MTTRPPLGCSVPNMVQRYLGTEYDTVKLIADNIETLLKLAKYIESGAYFQLVRSSFSTPSCVCGGKNSMESSMGFMQVFAFKKCVSACRKQAGSTAPTR